MKWFRAALLGALALLCACLAGCGGRELHQRVLVQAVGVDRTASGYEVTVRAASTAQEAGEELYTCRGATVLEALSSLSLSTGREPLYSHNALVVFGRSCGEEGLDRALDFFVRYAAARPTVQLYLAQDAARVLSAGDGEGLVPIDQLQSLGRTGPYNGQALSVDVLEFVNAARRPGSSPVLPLLREEDGRVELAGAAFFRDYRLAGTFSLEEARGYLAASGRLSGGELVVELPSRGVVTLSVSRAKTRVGAAFDGESPAFSLACRVEAEISSYAGGASLDEPFYAALEDAAARQLEGEISAALESALSAGCDIFGLGNRLSQRFPRRWEQLAPQWEQAMAQCAPAPQVEVQVQRVEQGGLAGG